MPKRHQSSEVDYSTGISKRGDGRVRTILYEAANVMLTGHRGDLKLKTWALRMATRSSMKEARVALARELAVIMHAMPTTGEAFRSA